MPTHAFSVFMDLLYIPSEPTIQSFLAMNDKEDTLTHSQMLHTSDSADFIQAQLLEVCGLENMDLFTYKQMTELSPHAKLLRSIWSYRHEHQPYGDLLE